MYALVRSRLTDDGLLVSDVEDAAEHVRLGAGKPVFGVGVKMVLACS